MNWFQKIIQIFKTPEIRNKILFNLGILAVFRLLANIPIPSINAASLKQFFQQFQIFGLLNIFTGGSLDNLSIVMIGLGPYITSVVILQLLTMIFPALEEMYKEGGEEGREKFQQYGRILTVPLAILQSYAMITLFQRQRVIPALSPMTLAVSILTITAGSVFLMWLGELVTEYGIGDGTSLLIFAGIIARLPNNIGQLIFVGKNVSSVYSYLIFFGLALIIIASVTLVNEAKRNVPVSYAKRVRGAHLYGGASTYLPININPAGVMPIIFALSILTFPSMIANFLTGSAGLVGTIARNINTFFSKPVVYGTLYFILISVFTYFYTFVTFDPSTISQNLQKMGGFIPGIRPGNSTASYLKFVLNRILLIGALFLGTIAILPEIISNLTKVTGFQFLVGGTSLLIVVGVILDTMRQINAQLEMREYEKL